MFIIDNTNTYPQTSCGSTLNRLSKWSKSIQRDLRRGPKKRLWHRRARNKRGEANKTEFPGYVPQSTCQKGYPKGPEEGAPDASRRSRSLQTCHREASRNWRTWKIRFLKDVLYGITGLGNAQDLPEDTKNGPKGFRNLFAGLTCTRGILLTS